MATSAEDYPTLGRVDTFNLPRPGAPVAVARSRPSVGLVVKGLYDKYDAGTVRLS
jgi:hypothetical protein